MNPAVRVLAREVGAETALKGRSFTRATKHIFEVAALAPEAMKSNGK